MPDTLVPSILVNEILILQSQNTAGAEAYKTQQNNEHTNKDVMSG